MKSFKKWIDCRAIALAAKLQPPPRAQLVPPLAAAQWLDDPNFLKPPAQSPQVRTTARGEFEFTSAVQTGAPENDRVRGKVWSVASGAPSIILVHGWNAELHYLHGFPRLATGLNARGLNAISFELPYHLRRRPPRPAPMRDFISDDIPGMLLATRQAVADLESLIRWARSQGSPRVALWGFSLGGWLAGLHLTQATSGYAAVLTTPLCDLKIAIDTLPFCRSVRQALEHASIPIERLNLAAHRPRIAPEKIFVTESLYDQFVPAETYTTLAQSWHLPAWQQLPQSHLSILISRRSMRFAMDWLSDALL